MTAKDDEIWSTYKEISYQMNYAHYSLLVLYAHHWNGHVILMKFSWLATLDIVVLTTFNAVSEKDFIKMMTFLFQWCDACFVAFQASISSIHSLQDYRKTSNIRRTNQKASMILISSWSRFWPILWSQVLSREWRCCWSSADRRCSNYIWVIDNLIAY